MRRNSSERLRVNMRSSRKKGRFVLTGSHQPALSESISQSLAGRIAICTLLPLSISELMRAGVRLSREQFVYNGFMPRLYDEKATVDWLYSNYEATYVERDISQIIRLKDRRVFENFLRLVAGRVGRSDGKRSFIPAGAQRLMALSLSISPQ